MLRARNNGLRKLCSCARRSWPKCEHSWHFNFKWNDETYRFSLERVIGRIVRGADGKWQRDRASLGDKITGKTEAERERDRLRAGIRDGTLQHSPEERPQAETLTLSQLMDTYSKRYLSVNRPDTLKQTTYQIALILRTELERPDGTRRAFGQWLAVDITTDTLEQFQRVRLARGATAANRDLELLRAMFAWAVRRDHVERTPFKKGTEVVVRMSRELQRRRRLQAGEGEKLLAACGLKLRAIVEAALETGCRKGELLSLQWWQVRSEPKAEIFLPAAKTKTKADRTVPASSRLKAVLEMRPRTDPDGEELPPEAYVFGNEVGEPSKSFKRAWARAVLVAHGHKPVYVMKPSSGTEKAVATALLAPESLAALRAINLHFHDLRREAGSRWLDAGVPLHRIQKWLGHANIAQTSTYLMADSVDDDEAMRRFEAQQSGLQRIAMEVGTEGNNGVQSSTVPDIEATISSAKHH
jgi:integrase